MTLSKVPGSLLVVREWINSYSDAPYLRPNCAAAELPTDNTTWGTSGFFVLTVIGGTHGVYTGSLRSPVLQIEAFAIQPNGDRPVWGAASNAIEALARACDDKDRMQRLLTLPHGYGTARMLGGYALSEPTKGYKNNQSAAIYRADFHFRWRSM